MCVGWFYRMKDSFVVSPECGAIASFHGTTRNSSKDGKVCTKLQYSGRFSSNPNFVSVKSMICNEKYRKPMKSISWNGFESIGTDYKRNYFKIWTPSCGGITSYRHRSTTGGRCFRWVFVFEILKIFEKNDALGFAPVYNIDFKSINILYENVNFSERVMQTSKECISWLCRNYGFIESKSSHLEKRNLRWRFIKVDS